MNDVPQEQGWIGINVEPIPILKHLTKQQQEQLYTGDLQEEKTNIPGEENPHFTVIYGLKKEGVPGATVKTIGKIPQSVSIIALEVFEKEDYDILVALIDKTSQIKKLREEVLKEEHYPQEFDDYKPHITLCYVKKDADLNSFRKSFDFLKGRELKTISISVDNPFAGLE